MGVRAVPRQQGAHVRAEAAEPHLRSQPERDDALLEVALQRAVPVYVEREAVTGLARRREGFQQESVVLTCVEAAGGDEVREVLPGPASLRGLAGRQRRDEVADDRGR